MRNKFLKHLQTFELYKGDHRTVGFRYSERKSENWIDVKFSPLVEDNYLDLLQSIIDEFGIPARIEFTESPDTIRLYIKSYSPQEAYGMYTTTIKGLLSKIPLEHFDLDSDIDRPRYGTRNKIGFK
jgi:hypothetical protein